MVLRPNTRAPRPTPIIVGRIESYMTPSPYAIGADEPITAARELMGQHDLRHLPVLDEVGALLGVVSEAEVLLLDTLRGVEVDQIPVRAVMTTEVYAIPPRASLAQVATEMAERKIDAAVVMQNNEVVGVFTVTDALRALADVLRTA